MTKASTNKVVKEIGLNFFIQSIEDNSLESPCKYKIKVKVSDHKGNSVEHIFRYPCDYETPEVLANIRKLLRFVGSAQSNKFVEGAKEEILIWLALLISRVYW